MNPSFSMRYKPITINSSLLRNSTNVIMACNDRPAMADQSYFCALRIALSHNQVHHSCLLAIPHGPLDSHLMAITPGYLFDYGICLRSRTSRYTSLVHSAFLSQSKYSATLFCAASPMRLRRSG